MGTKDVRSLENHAMSLPASPQVPEHTQRDTAILDQAAKRLFGESPRATLRLAGATVPEGTLIRREDVSVNIAEHRADQVFVPEVPDNPWALQTEYAAQPDPRQHARWLYKNACLNVQLKIPVLLVVVYLEKGDYATFHAGCTVEGGGISNAHQWSTVRLWEHVEEIRHGELRELAPFLPLCFDHPGEEILEETKAIIRELDVSETRREEMTAIAIMSGRRRFDQSVLESVFQEELPMLKEMPFVQEWMADCRDEGRDEGVALGALIGRIEFAGQLLGRDLPSRVELRAMPVEALQALSAKLESDLRR